MSLRSIKRIIQIAMSLRSIKRIIQIALYSYEKTHRLAGYLLVFCSMDFVCIILLLILWPLYAIFWSRQHMWSFKLLASWVEQKIRSLESEIEILWGPHPGGRFCPEKVFSPMAPSWWLSTFVFIWWNRSLPDKWMHENWSLIWAMHGHSKLWGPSVKMSGRTLPNQLVRRKWFLSTNLS